LGKQDIRPGCWNNTTTLLASTSESQVDYRAMFLALSNVALKWAIMTKGAGHRFGAFLFADRTGSKRISLVPSRRCIP
jgi:hypothetical protein